jgi:hypothetical protein
MDTSRFGHVVLRTSRFCVLALIVVGGVLVATLTSFSTSLTSASAVASWSTPKAVDAQSPYGLKSVSCVAANFCIAVDSNGNFLSYNGISWSTPQNIDSSHNFYSVSCVTKDFCVAVDYANVLVFNGSAWSAPQRIDFQPADNLDSVSCSSTIYCMAVSSMGFAFTMSGTAWSGPGLISSNGNLFGVSCPPSSGAESCNIVGGSGGSNSGQAFVYNGNTSSGVGVVSNGSLFGISCPSEIFCAAVDLSSDVLFKNGATWSSPNVIDAGSGMVSVSCPSVAFCVAVDKNGNALTYNGTSWSSPSAIDAGFWLTSVSCPTSTFCAAVDNYGGCGAQRRLKHHNFFYPRYHDELDLVDRRIDDFNEDGLVAFQKKCRSWARADGASVSCGHAASLGSGNNRGSKSERSFQSVGECECPFVRNQVVKRTRIL